MGSACLSPTLAILALGQTPLLTPAYRAGNAEAHPFQMASRSPLALLWQAQGIRAHGRQAGSVPEIAGRLCQHQPLLTCLVGQTNTRTRRQVLTPFPLPCFLYAASLESRSFVRRASRLSTPSAPLCDVSLEQVCFRTPRTRLLSLSRPSNISPSSC